MWEDYCKIDYDVEADVFSYRFLQIFNQGVLAPFGLRHWVYEVYFSFAVRRREASVAATDAAAFYLKEIDALARDDDDEVRFKQQKILWAWRRSRLWIVSDILGVDDHPVGSL